MELEVCNEKQKYVQGIKKSVIGIRFCNGKCKYTNSHVTPGNSF